MSLTVAQEPRQGKRLRLTVGGFGRLGECLADYQGEAMYVFGAIPGEEVVAEVVRQRRHYIAARVVEVAQPSPRRVQPPCPYFWPCTGCQWQHIDYQAQLEIKRQQVLEALQKGLGLADPAVMPTLPSPAELGYRNHARFTIGPEGALGFVNHITREFVPIERCLLMHPAINEALGKLQGHCGETTQLSIRYGVNTGKLLVQPALQDQEVALPTGQREHEEALLGRRFRIAASSFFQVNTAQTEHVVQLLCQHLRLAGGELLVDAYAGVGTFAVLVSPYVRRVIAIEESASAVRDAQANAQGVYKVEFRQGKTEDLLGGLGVRPDVVILDPPRTGCQPAVLEALNSMAPSQVAYLSCDPETLARDLRILLQGPFSLDLVQPVDMFPQTHHVECLVVLRRQGGKGTPFASITLASASPRRRALLQELGLEFEAIAPAIEEGAPRPEEKPEAMAERLALEKALAGSKRAQSGLVLGADTLVVLDGAVLGKPRTPDEARQMLLALRGRTHEVVTGVAVVDAASGRAQVTHKATQVTMRAYAPEEVERFVSSGEPMDKAGAYAIQDPDFRPAIRVEGCYPNVVGLPLCVVTELLRGFGVAAHPRSGWSPPEGCQDCPLSQGSRANTGA